MDATALFVVSVVFLATVVRSTLGFGEALIAVPLLAIFLPVKVAAPVAVLVSITIAATVLAQDWKHVDFRSAGLLVLSSLVGIPLGLLLLTSVPDTLVKGILSVVIVGFALFSLLGAHSWHLHDDRYSYLFGFFAGILGGAYGMNGPPLVVYGSLRGWRPALFRATLQGYFLPASAAAMIGYWQAGLWVPSVTHYFLLSLAPVIGGVLLGRAIHNRMEAERFQKSVHVGLLAIGVLLLIQALN